MSFNLLQEAWIPVVNDHWQCQELSLIDFFRNWQNLREIQADNPPTTLAIHRFLIAILHRAYSGPRDEEHWEEIRDDCGQKAIEYLQQHADRFDLFHPEYPFMQDLALTVDKAVPIFALHTMSTCKVFSHEHKDSGYKISFAEAARLVLRLQFVDVTSLRAYYPLLKAGNRSAVNTPSINNANVLITGENLKSTLLLNLMQYHPASGIPSTVNGDDIPSWETSYAGMPKQSIPAGYISYLAYPWRRVKIFPTGNSVQDINITMGNSLPENISFKKWECAIAFREDKPVRLSPKRQIWRDSHNFLQSSEKEYCPRIIEWIADLYAEDLVDETIKLQIFGMCADKAKPLAWSIERFSAPTIYILDKSLGQSLKIVLSIAEEHQNIFRSFKGSPYHALAETLKNSDAGKLASSLNGETRYWATLDREFQILLTKLPKDKTTDANGTIYGINELPTWTQTVQRAAQNAFTDSIESIRNYEARAKALQALGWKLADLRLTPIEREERKARVSAPQKVSQDTDY
jgi:CRISPR system Cascade subunit CasA